MGDQHQRSSHVVHDHLHGAHLRDILLLLRVFPDRVWRDVRLVSWTDRARFPLAVLVGLLVAVLVYCAYFHFIADPRMARMEAEKPGSVPPEARLKPGLAATFPDPNRLVHFW